MLDAIDTSSLRRWAVVSRAALAARRAEIDALNVFPVPDGDTGTNMYLTLDQALDAVRVDHERRGILGRAELDDEVTTMSRAALLSARGNSGVILSQLIRGMSEAFVEADRGESHTTVVARGLTKGAELARASIARPQEGTILSVADAAAATATRLAAEGASLAELTAQTVTAAAEALSRTPEQLEVLRQAGVVDAGGAGYLLFLEALDRIVRDQAPLDGFAVDEFTMNLSMHRREGWTAPADAGTDAGPGVTDSLGHEVHPLGGSPAGEQLIGNPDGPDFEVMYLLDGADEAKVAALRQDLDGIGDSVVVSGAAGLWSVHVHTDDIGAALELALDAGRPHRVVVTPLSHVLQPRPRVGLAVVACAAGPGIAALFEAAGATTVASGPARRASAGELLAAVRATGASDVIILPNDRDTHLAAEAACQAAGQEEITVHVVHSTTAVQGVAALAVYDPNLSAHRNAVTMTRSSAATRHGAITIAAKAGLTTGGPCEVGDVLGVVSGDITIVGADQVEVALQVLGDIGGPAPELVTIVRGEDATDELVDAIIAGVCETHRGVEFEVIEGGQPHYTLLLGVE